MELLIGDYISCLWLCESPGAAWTITAILRAWLDCWEVTLTWDRANEPGESVKCNTPLQQILLPSTYTEQQIMDQVEHIIANYENLGVCKRVATVEVHSTDHKVFIDKFLEVAQQNEKIACTFVTRDLIQPEPPVEE